MLIDIAQRGRVHGAAGDAVQYGHGHRVVMAIAHGQRHRIAGEDDPDLRSAGQHPFADQRRIDRLGIEHEIAGHINAQRRRRLFVTQRGMRRQAAEATTDTARAIHFGIAEDHERKAGIG